MATGRRRAERILVVAMALAVVGVLALAVVKPAATRSVFGEDPRPVLDALNDELARIEILDGLELESTNDHAGSGTVCVVDHYRDPLAAGPALRQELLATGWAPKERSSAPGREPYAKEVSGREATLVVAAGEHRLTIEISATYRVGLIRG